MTRTQWTLLVLLLAQVLLLVLARVPLGSEATAAGPRPFLPMLQSATPSRIEIDEPAAGDDGGAAKSVVLRREGERWVLDRPQGYPADPVKVTKLLDNLRGLEVGRPVLSSDRYHESVEVTEQKYQRRLRLWGEAGERPEHAVLLGTSPNYRIRHARLSGDDRVYELRGLEYHDLRPDPAAWIDKKLVDVPVDDVTAVRLENGRGGFVLERGEEGWRVAGHTAAPDPSKVDSFVRSVASLWIAEPGGPLDPAAQGLDRPEATLELSWKVIARAEDGDDEAGAPEGAETPPPATFATETRTVTVRVGREAEGEQPGKRYAARDGFGFAVLLAPYDAEKLTGKALADLLAADGS